MVAQGIKKPEKLSDAKINAILLKTCSLVSGARVTICIFAQLNETSSKRSRSSNQLDADRIHKLLAALSEWLDLEIIYRRSGNRFAHFSFTRSRRATDGAGQSRLARSRSQSQNKSPYIDPVPRTRGDRPGR